MTSVLAVETSGTLCSVCLDLDGSRFVDTRHVERRHNEMLLPMIDALLREANVSLDALQALAFGCGPGSFTGVRIAAAALQGMALARNLPVVPVPSSLALAEAAVADAAARADTGSCSFVCTSIRSRADLYYLALYQRDGERLIRVHDDRLCASASDLAFTVDTAPDGLLLAGEQPSWWRAAAGAPPFQAVDVTGETIAELARGMLAKGGGVDAAAALPLYVAGDAPWVPSRRGSA